MPSDLIFMDGAGGYIGFAILCAALREGYQVRAGFRSKDKAEAVTSAPYLETLGEKRNQLSTVVIPDFTALHAFDEAAKGCKYIIHLASALPQTMDEATENNEETFVRGAKKGTLGVLEAAKASGSVKRVILTTSYGGMRSLLDMFGPDADKALTTAQSRLPEEPGPFATDMLAYHSSKVAALNASEAWMQQNGKHIGFDMISIAPAFVLGRNELARKPADLFTSSTMWLMNLLIGQQSPMKLTSCFTHVDDMANVHVAALDVEKIPGNRLYLSASNGLRGAEWEDAKEILKENFPHALEKGWLSMDGTLPTICNPLDASQTESVFGFKHKLVEEQMKDTIAQYCELKEKEEKEEKEEK